MVFGAQKISIKLSRHINQSRLLFFSTVTVGATNTNRNLTESTLVKKANMASKKLSRSPREIKSARRSSNKFFAYTPVQHADHIAIHGAWYNAKTGKIISIESAEESLPLTVEELLEFIANFRQSLPINAVEFATLRA